jgi:type IV secretory pathway TrbL component
VIVGAYFHEFLSRYYLALWILFGVTVVWTVFLWARKMKSRPQ